MPLATVREMLDAGLHYGHHVSRWNPKMKPYIFGKRNFIHIVNLRETMLGLVTACRFIAHTVASGKMVVFVGTKRQARRTVRDEAIGCGMPFVTERWLGGTLTNFRTIRSRLERLDELESIVEGPGIEHLSKKQGSRMKRELAKIRRNLDGIRKMDQLPGAVVVVDPKREKIAIAEATRLNIPTIALADTDCDPDLVDMIIPGNDDAMRAVQLILSRMAGAVVAGKERRIVIAREEAAASAPDAAPAAEAAGKPAAEAKAGTGGTSRTPAKPKPPGRRRGPGRSQASDKGRPGGGPRPPAGPKAEAKPEAAPAPKPEAAPASKPEPKPEPVPKADAAPAKDAASE